VTSTLDRLSEHVREHGLHLSVYYDPDVVTPDLRWEIRIVGTVHPHDVRVRQTGATGYEAAGKALTALNQPGPNEPDTRKELADE
jgi:hypothetical protein